MARMRTTTYQEMNFNLIFDILFHSVTIPTSRYGSNAIISAPWTCRCLLGTGLDDPAFLRVAVWSASHGLPGFKSGRLTSIDDELATALCATEQDPSIMDRVNALALEISGMDPQVAAADPMDLLSKFRFQVRIVAPL